MKCFPLDLIYTYVINTVSFCAETLQSGKCFFWQEISPFGFPIAKFRFLFFGLNCQDFTLHPVSLHTYTKQKYMYMFLLS
jgi:hypothetical protein